MKIRVYKKNLYGTDDTRANLLVQEIESYVDTFSSDLENTVHRCHWQNVNQEKKNRIFNVSKIVKTKSYGTPHKEWCSSSAIIIINSWFEKKKNFQCFESCENKILWHSTHTVVFVKCHKDITADSNQWRQTQWHHGRLLHCASHYATSHRLEKLKIILGLSCFRYMLGPMAYLINTCS